ncbi:hypothetical protein [Belnapia rosea]|nr:hypothetical protein [Belnapia rosea]
MLASDLFQLAQIGFGVAAEPGAGMAALFKAAAEFARRRSFMAK